MVMRAKMKHRLPYGYHYIVPIIAILPDVFFIVVDVREVNVRLISLPKIKTIAKTVGRERIRHSMINVAYAVCIQLFIIRN